MKHINLSGLRNPKSYTDYHAQIQSVIDQGVGNELGYSAGQVDITALNQRRMLRHDKRFAKAPISDQVNMTDFEVDAMTWVVLSEGWCGDAAHIMPVISHLADSIENVELVIVNRDENLPLMDAFTTNGGRAIPKMIFTDKKGCVLSSWGARPEVLQAQFLAAKKAPDFDKHEVNMQIQRWYNNDKGVSTAKEILKLLGNLEETTCFDDIAHQPRRVLG
jgi:hypothetical protein